MYTQANQAKIDPALQALLAVAKQVTPTGQPTVAAQMTEAAQQPPQPSQPQGIEAALEQSATAAPSVAQLMQQQQMPPEMPPEMQPQMEPPMEPQGGIASLPVPVGEYAEGGVVGYAGQEGSYVSMTDPMGGLTGLLEEDLKPPTKAEERVISAQEKAAEIRARMNAHSPESSDYPTASERQFAEVAEKIYPRATVRPPSFAMQEGTEPLSLIRALAYELKDPSTSPAARLAISQKIQELTAQAPSAIAAPPRPDRAMASERAADVGILTPRPEPTMPSIERPTAASAMEMARLLVPNVDRSESRRLYEERKAQQAASPDFEAMKAKALEESAAQEYGGRGMEKLLQALGGLSQGGVRGMAGSLRQYEQTTKGLDAAYKQGQIALKEAAQAKAEGNLTKLMEANAKLEEAEAKQAELISRAGIQALSSQSSQYATDVGAASDVARIASAERIAKGGGTQGALLELFQRDPALFASFTEATAGGKKSRDAIVAGYIDDYNKLALDPMARADLIKRGIKTEDEYIQFRDSLLQRAAGSSAGSPVPPEVAAALQKHGVR